MYLWGVSFISLYINSEFLKATKAFKKNAEVEEGESICQT